jgi:hypothetical protein
MAKARQSSRRKSNGKRSPSTQELRLRLHGVKGETDGTQIGHSAVPGFKPQLARRKPRESSGRLSKLTRSDIERLPSDALVGMDGASQAVIALYDVEFDSVSDVVRAINQRIRKG